MHIEILWQYTPVAPSCSVVLELFTLTEARYVGCPIAQQLWLDYTREVRLNHPLELPLRAAESPTKVNWVWNRSGDPNWVGFDPRDPTACERTNNKGKGILWMSDSRPAFVFPDANWQVETRYFNGIAIPLFRTEGDVGQIEGWVDNPRVDMILKRWRNSRHMSVDAVPNDEEMLELMLNYDVGSFDIQALGEDVKQNGVREPIIVTWDGTLIDGNRRKFAVMWALSERGGASHDQEERLRRIPMFVLPEEAPDSHRQSIIIQENYAESLKKEWPQVVTNGRIFSRYQHLTDQYPNDDELAIRRRLRDEFPRFTVTELRNRLNTWLLIEEFRADYSDIEDEDDLEAKIDRSFQYFRQANDTFRTKPIFADPDFKELLFRGIEKDLFPSFTSVRRLEDIHGSPQATEIFLSGEGMSGTGLRANFDRATAEAGREAATKNLSVEKRLETIVDTINNLTSVELASVPEALRSRLVAALERIIAQATVSTDATEGSNEAE